MSNTVRGTGIDIVSAGYPSLTIRCDFCGVVFTYDSEDLAGWDSPNAHDLHTA